MGVRDEGCLAFYMGWTKEALDMDIWIDLHGAVIDWKVATGYKTNHNS